MVAANLAPFTLRMDLFRLHCQAREQLSNLIALQSECRERIAELELRLACATDMIETTVCRAELKRLRAALFASELHQGAANDHL